MRPQIFLENETFEENFSSSIFAKKGQKMGLQMHFVKKAKTSLIGGVAIFSPQLTFKIQQRFCQLCFAFFTQTSADLHEDSPDHHGNNHLPSHLLVGKVFLLVLAHLNPIKSEKPNSSQTK